MLKPLFPSIPGHFLRRPTGPEVEEIRSAMKDYAGASPAGFFFDQVIMNGFKPVDGCSHMLWVIADERSERPPWLNDGFRFVERATRLLESEIHQWHSDMREYFNNRLVDVNGHKILSILAHFGWLFREIKRCNLGSQLRSAAVLIDDENLPASDLTDHFLRSFIAAGLQDAGMSYRITGGCFRRNNGGGCNVVVDAFSKSHQNPGLQYVDILIQVVQRQLPGFGSVGRTVSSI